MKPIVTAEEMRQIIAKQSPRTLEEWNKEADRMYEMSPFRNMTPEEEAKARRMGPEMVDDIRKVRERRERAIKERMERDKIIRFPETHSLSPE